ncbi:MAG: glycine betaine ABC transporter substrate-binding protein [Steroidobacteraceae bacterium]
MRYRRRPNKQRMFGEISWVFAWLLVVVAGGTPADVASAADITIGIPNWPSVNVTAHIIQLIIEENFGLSVELQSATNPVIFEAMAKGSVDVHPEVWLPNQQNLFDRYADGLVRNAHPATGVQGMCVNGAAQRAGIRDISDLTDPAKAALLDSHGDGRGEIFIGAPGWSSTVIERIKAIEYGYDQVLELKQMDEGLADSQLTIAERRGLPWVGFCYAPHHRFVIHPDLKLLTEPPYEAMRWKLVQPNEDPDWVEKSYVAMALPTQSIQPVYAKTLLRAHPLVAGLMRNMDISRDDISGFSYQVVVNKKDPVEFARTWVAGHAQRVADWLR